MKPRGDGGAADGKNAGAAGELRRHCFARRPERRTARFDAGDCNSPGARGTARPAPTGLHPRKYPVWHSRRRPSPVQLRAGNCAKSPHRPVPAQVPGVALPQAPKPSAAARGELREEPPPACTRASSRRGTPAGAPPKPSAAARTRPRTRRGTPAGAPPKPSAAARTRPSPAQLPAPAQGPSEAPPQAPGPSPAQRLRSRTDHPAAQGAP
jgi:hypothetical protein